jgi:hypothetical protein
MVISLAAVVYGLQMERASHFMAMEIMALLNAFFMAFTILASRQQRWRRAIESRRGTLLADHYLRKLRIRIWNTNHTLMRYFRYTAPLLLVLIVVMSFSLLTKRESFRYSLLTDPQMMEVIARYRKADPAYEQFPWLSYAGTKPGMDLRILKPAVVLFPGESTTYRALLYRSNQWTTLKSEDGWTLEWFLIRLDEDIEAFRMNRVGQDNHVRIQIPGNYPNYRIMLKASKGDAVVHCIDRLNTPLPPTLE